MKEIKEKDHRMATLKQNVRALESQNAALACTQKATIDRLTNENHQLMAELRQRNDSSNVGEASNITENDANSVVGPDEEATHEHPLDFPSSSFGGGFTGAWSCSWTCS